MCFSPYEHILGSHALQHALLKDSKQPSTTGAALNSLEAGGTKVFYALGSAGVASNAEVQCDSEGKHCGLALGYTHQNNGRCFQIRLNTDGWNQTQGTPVPKHIDVILQSINTGLNNAFDIYMAQGGAGAWSSNMAYGRHGTCSHVWGNVPGFNYRECEQNCIDRKLPKQRCLHLCDRARCPSGESATYEECAATCTGGSNVSVAKCTATCRIHCPQASVAQTSTWPAEFRENIWAKNLLDTPLCRTNFTSDAHMRSAISEWFSFVNPMYPDAAAAKASLLESAFQAVKNGIGCTNPSGSWQEVPCPHQLTEISGLRRNDTHATRFCNHTSGYTSSAAWPCNPNLRPIESRRGVPLRWATHQFGGSGEEWQQKYVLRTDAQITQMMDCRSPDASQCFNLPSGATWSAGRGAAFNVDADGALITQPGVLGCANLPDELWTDEMGGPVPYLPGVKACPVAFSPKATSTACKRYSNSALCSSMITGGQCWPGAGVPAVSTFNASNPGCWTASQHSYCPLHHPASKTDVFGDCAPGTNTTCCAPLKCFPFSSQFSQCCVGPNNPPGCASWPTEADSGAKAATGITPVATAAASSPVATIHATHPTAAIQPKTATQPTAAPQLPLPRPPLSRFSFLRALASSPSSTPTPSPSSSPKATTRSHTTKGYCPILKPATAGDVNDACTPGLHVVCCAPLKCVAQSSYFSACCIAKGDPPGCASPPPPPPLPKTCGVQEVSAGSGYATTTLGETSPAAFNTCIVTVAKDYSDPAMCNQPPLKTVTCGGHNEMVPVNYPQYGRTQYECKQTNTSRGAE